MRAMICRIVQRAFIDSGGGGGGGLSFCDRQPVCVDSTLNEPVLSAKAY